MAQLAQTYISDRSVVSSSSIRILLNIIAILRYKQKRSPLVMLLEYYFSYSIKRLFPLFTLDAQYKSSPKSSLI